MVSVAVVPGAEVVGEIEYLARDSQLNRRYVAPGAELNTGRYEKHSVRFRNARALAVAPDLNVQGFELRCQPTVCSDMSNAGMVGTVLAAEVQDLVVKVTGADLVLILGSQLRHTGTTAAASQPQATDVHVDYVPERAAAMAARMFAESGHQQQRYARCVAFNHWRILSPPPQDWPLALCDARSVGADEGVENLMIRCAALPTPEQIAAPLGAAEQRMAAHVFHYSPAHEWYYFPAMQPGEVLLFKLYDSAAAGGGRVPHVSFHDVGVLASYPRESIETRAIAYYF
jgi:hypothetical protein